MEFIIDTPTGPVHAIVEGKGARGLIHEIKQGVEGITLLAMAEPPEEKQYDFLHTLLARRRAQSPRFEE